MLKKLFRYHWPYFLVIFLVTLVAYYQTLNFYFWHDDFSILYNAVNKVCPFVWPFNSYCPIFERLYDLFGFNPKPYFLLGFFLRAIIGIFFFALCKEIFNNKKLALLLACLAVSVGGEDSLLSFYSISENIGMSLLIVILLLIKKFSEEKKWWYFLAVVLLFFISLSLFPIYSTGNILIVIPVVVYLFASRLNKKLFFVLTAIFSLITLNTYVLEPYRIDGNARAIFNRTGNHKITLGYLKEKFSNYVETTGSFVVTDYVKETYLTRYKIIDPQDLRFKVGLILNASFIIFILKNKKNKKIFILALFALIWIITQYIPKGLVTSAGLDSTDRHIYYPYLGFVLALGAIALRNLKIWQWILLLLIILNLLQTNYYFNSFREVNMKRSLFYEQLKSYFPNKPEKMVIFLDSPQREQIVLSDFVRTGMYPSEASVATKLGLKIENVIVLVDSDGLLKYLKTQPKPDNFHSFYYDGKNLINTTEELHKLITSQAQITKQFNTSSKMKFIKGTNVWSGENKGVVFKFEDFNPLLPAYLTLNVKADFPDLPLPFSQNCTNCFEDPALFKMVLSEITLSRALKQSMHLSVANTDNDTLPNSLIDFNLNTYWRADRNKWFNGIKPVISLQFPDKTNIDGIIIYASSNNQRPKSFAISSGNKEVGYKQEYSNNRIKIIFKNTNVKDLNITILTTEGDAPIIDEIGIIPENYSDLDLEMLDQVRQAPAGSIDTLDGKQILRNYLSFGIDACVKWENHGYGEGKVNLLLKVDGLTHEYKVLIPSMGKDNPNFTIDCLNFPVDLEFFSGSIIPFVQQQIIDQKY